MKKSLPPLGWFRAFDAAARHLSFTLAADELGLTQSAVSQQMRSLETRLGEPLFVRLPRGLALTDAGRRLVPDVAAALSRLQTATESFLPISETRILTVATSVSIAQWVLAPNLGDFQKAHPDIGVRLITAVWPDDFSAAEADVEIRFGSKEVAGRDGVPLGTNQMVAVARPDNCAGVKTLTDLAELPLIQPVGVTENWARFFRVNGQNLMTQPVLFADSHSLAVDLAIGGAGVALVNRLIARTPLRDGRLTLAWPTEVSGTEQYFIATNDRQPNSPAALFSDWIRQIVATVDSD